MGGGGSSASSASSGSSTASGDVYITADPRQNALWVQANGLDMQLIEQLIEIIDTETGPVDIRTRGIPRIIYLETAPVAQVEATVKAVFADRLSSNAQAASQRPPSPQEFIEALRGGGGGGRNRGSAPKELKEQTMSITADTKNNALIVMAPKQLFDDVEALVKELDKTAEGAEDSVVVVPLGGEVNPTTIRNALSSVFGSQARTSTTSNPQPATSSTNNPQASAGGFRGFNPANFGGGQAFQGFGGGGNPFGGGGNPFGGGGAGGGRNPFGGGGMQGFQGFRGMGGGGFGGNQGGGNQGGGNQGGGNQGGGNRVNRNRGN
jgi:hypothetical protein